jgi:uncharacterized protein YutE (UPF0331/DUF86 family)
MMKLNPATLPKYLQLASYKKHGDRYEQEFGHFLSGDFPNSESFWKIFVVPFTKRIEGYPNQIAQSIDIRQNIDPRIEDIANAHYSMFLNLIFAHLHLENRKLSSLENIYTHLGSTCDLAETTIEKWYFLILNCQGKETKTLQKMSREDFLEKAGNWYDEKYLNLYNYYLSRGKIPPFKLISSDDIIVEYLGKKTACRNAYAQHSQNIRQFRNVIVHDVRVARIIDEKLGQTLIPKPQVIDKYRSWRNVLDIVGNKERIEEDFAEQYQQAKGDLETLERILNDIWKILIKDFEEEFYSKERDVLRKMYDIEFSSDGPIISDINGNGHDISPRYTQPSGTYTGGTIEYRRPNDDLDSKITGG